jgi:rhamnosyltransferase
MVRQADCVVCDSQNIEKYIQQEYGAMRPRTCFIAYGADLDDPGSEGGDEKYARWLQEHDLNSGEYYLVVGRFVPENNFATMIREYMASQTNRPLVLVTNQNSKFSEALEQQFGFSNDDRIRFVGTVYDSALLRRIRENARGYLHGHEVGGTNPSLLEALSCTRVNLLLDVGFNREVGLDAALYWTKEPGNLASLIHLADRLSDDECEAMGRRARDRIRQAYSWPYIADRYRELWLGQENAVR